MSRSSGDHTPHPQQSQPRVQQPARKRLPVNPSAEHLRKQAKRLAKQDPSLSLADAQHRLAGEYGCRQWAELMKMVQTMSRGTTQLVNVDAENEPLPTAVNKNDLAEVARILREENFTQHDLDLGLARAVLRFREREAIARLLIDHGADPNGQYGSNYGPIVLVTGECLDPDGLQFLIDHGCDVSFPPIQSKYGLVSPMIGTLAAYVRGQNEAKHRCIEILLKHNAHVPDQMFTPEMLAIHRGDTQALGAILDRDPELIRRQYDAIPFGNVSLDGATLLHLAVEYGEFECIDLLLDRWADINVRAKIIDEVGGQTPIFHTVASVQNWNQQPLERVLQHLIQRCGRWIDMSVRTKIRVFGTVKGPFTPLESVGENARFREIMAPLDRASQLNEAIRRGDPAEVSAMLDAHPELLTPGLWPVAIFQAKSLEITRLLLDRGLDPNQCSAPRKPLHLAVDRGLTETVQLLLEHGADPNVVDGENVTPLELAAGAISGVRPPNADESIALLRNAGAAASVFTLILLGEDEAAIERFERDPALLQSTGWIGFPPLHAASRAGRPQVVAKLLQLGLAPNGPDDIRNSPLWFACQSGADAAARIETARALLEAGADPNRSCEENSTPMHFAAWRGPAEMVRLLLSHGGRNWAGDEKGKTPVDYAKDSNVSSDKEAILKLLTEMSYQDENFRAAVEAMDAGDVERLQQLLRDYPHLVTERVEHAEWFAGPYFTRPTLLHFIANNPNRSKTMPPRTLESAEAILAAGAEVDAETEAANGGTTLALVASSEPARKSGLQVPLIELLVRHGADPGKGLGAAIAHHEMDAIQAMLRLGAKHTLQSAAGLGALADLRRLLNENPSEPARLQAAQAAAIHGQVETLALLLDTGLDINARLDHPFSPTLLHEAAWHGHPAVAKLLLSRGADRGIRDKQYNGTPADWARVNGKEELAELLKG